MKKKLKATLSIFLCALMVLCSVAVGGMFANADTNTGKAIQLVKDGAAANISGGQASNIYFGTYKQSSDGNNGYNTDPIKWRVLANNTSSKQLFLLSDQALDTVQYHTEKEEVTWEKSTIRSWLNGYGASYNNGGASGTDYSNNNFKDTAFSADEQSAIVLTKGVVNNDNTYDGNNTEGGEDTDDKIFLLSIDEANNYFTNSAARMCVPTDYAISRNAMIFDSCCWWWLRSPGGDSDYAAHVSRGGVVSYNGFPVDYVNRCVRPAFNLNLESVIFTSAAEGGKISSAEGGDALSKIADYTGNDWKVTLKDADREFKVTESNAFGEPGETITLSYSGATIYNKDFTPNEYISVIITDSTGNAIYYGRVMQSTSKDGKVDIKIPSDLANGEYTLNVFSEQYNGGANDDTKLTDYASEFSAVDLTVKPYEISVNFDENSGDWAEDYTKPTSYMSNVTLTMPTKDNISRTGYTFDGWELLSTSSRTVKNYKAKWKINQYTLTFVLGNGEENVTITQDYNTNVTAPAPTRVGYIFDGWDKTVPSTMPAKNETYTAKWLVKKYTITFNTDGGTDVDSITQDYETEITTKPQNPTKVGYTFDGWEPVIPDKMPLNGMKIKAKWKINQYTLTFVLGNGEENVTITQNYNTNVTAPAPTRVGYTFDGWDKVVPSTMPAESVTYTAKWLTCDHAESTDKPTCEKSAVCSECGATLPATGHTFGEWKTTKSATFFKDGVETRTCINEGCTETETRVVLSKFSEFKSGLFGTDFLKAILTVFADLLTSVC